MTRRDDNHKTATIIKGLEERLADLEEKDRTIGTPNVLRTQRDRVGVGDQIDNVEETGLVDLRWNDVPVDFSEGYGETAYGETPYGEAAETSLDPDAATAGDDGDYAEGGYGEGGYGGVVPSVWTIPSESGWGYGMWGSYRDEIIGGTELTVQTGETHTIPSDEEETYTQANIDGTLDVDGTLETE